MSVCGRSSTAIIGLRLFELRFGCRMVVCTSYSAARRPSWGTRGQCPYNQGMTGHCLKTRKNHYWRRCRGGSTFFRLASEIGPINKKQVQLQDMTPIEVVEDAQKKVSNGIALLASADSRRIDFPTQVAQKEEEERGVSSGMRGAEIHKHYQAEEVVNKGSREGQATEGWRLGKSATSRVTPGGTPGGRQCPHR